jgi:hypothetical protein
MNRLNPRIPAVVVLTGVAVAAALLIASSLKYPAIFGLPGAGVVIAVTVVALLGYAACGAWALWHPAAGQRTGLAWGALGAAMWAAEIWAGGPARLGHSAEQATGLTFVLLAVAATVTAGIHAARQIGTARAAWQAGLFSGVVSGIALYAFGVIMTLATLPILASRGDYRAQFAHSHAPDIATFLMGDIFAAVTAHLIINLFLGLAGGGLGALIARGARPAPAVA